MAAHILMVIGGPNGSGKSTISAEYPPIGYYVNADAIKRHLSCNNIEAAKIAESTREYLLENNENFTFESVMSTPRNFLLMGRAKKRGYHIACIYVLTYNPDINIYRVESRAKKGGHSVQPEKVRARYYRAMQLFPNLFLLCDECYVYDNSLDRSVGEPSLILSWRSGQLSVLPNSIWSLEMLINLYNGNYNGNKTKMVE